jgi:hypothetical protein
VRARACVAACGRDGRGCPAAGNLLNRSCREFAELLEALVGESQEVEIHRSDLEVCG